MYILKMEVDVFVLFLLLLLSVLVRPIYKEKKTLNGHEKAVKLLFS